MTMAKRKLSTGGNIYFTLDNYGRKKANLFLPGGPLDADFDASGLQTDFGSDWRSDLANYGAKSTADLGTGDGEEEDLNFGQKLKKFGQENGEAITDTLGGLGLGIGYASQRRYNRKHNLLKAAGVTNYRGKYTFGNGGNLYGLGGEKGEKIAGGIAQGLESAGSIAALTAQNASIADTSELEGAIQDKANVQVTAGSNDDLMSEWASRGPELKHVSWKDVRGQSAGKSFGNIMSAGAAGAKAGMKAGPIGAVAGAVGGIFSSTFGAIAGRRKAKKKAKKLNAAIDAANERNLASFEQRAENIDTNNDLTAMRNYAALGGPLSMYSPYAFGVQGPLEYALMQEDLDIKQQRADNAGESSLSGLTFGKGGGIHINPKNKGKLTATSKRTGKPFSELAHSKNPLTRKRAIFALNARKWHHGKKHAFGGDLESNGANWDLGFTSIGNGGTHEMNPYEGVQMGTDSKGIPNLVEQGEIVYNDYVFSNRLNATPDLLQAYNLPKKYKGMTFSDIASKISGETKERPNDPISQKGYEDQMERLIQAQEYVRQAQQYAAQQQQLAQQQAYQNALAQQAYNNQQLGAMQGMVSPEEQMGLGQYGCGGKMKFACGGRKFSHGGKRGRLFSGDDTGSQELGSEDKLSLMDWLNANGLTLNSPDILGNYWQYYSSGNSATPATPAQPISADMSDKDWKSLTNYLHDNAFSGNVGDVISAYTANNPTAPVTPASTSQLPEWYSKILKEGNNQEIEKLLEMMGSDDENVQKFLEENYPGYKDYQNSLQSLYKKDKPYKTWMRYAPALGSALGLGLSTFWKPNMDYANKIQAAADAAGRFERVGWNPVGNYLQYRPFDTQYALNQLNSQFGATNRAAINNANGNRATAMANLLASQHNYGNQVGGLYAQALQYNDAQRKATEEFNRATNLANSEGFLKADMANQSARQAAMNSRLQGTVYAQNMKNDLDVGRRNSIASNLTGLFNNIGNIGSENFAFNEARSNPWFLYGIGPNGWVSHTGAKGGYLTMGNRRRSRRRK